MNTTDERLTLFRELATCTQNLTFSIYNSEFVNIYCNNEIENALYTFLAIDNPDLMNPQSVWKTDFSASQVNLTKPLICNNSLGMFWISEGEYKEHILYRIHVVGPVFTSDYSLQDIQHKMDALHLSISIKKSFLQFVQTLPVIPLAHMHEYGCMLHYCLYQEKIGVADLTYLNFKERAASTFPSRKLFAPEQTYLATKQLLDMIESGNLEYQKAKAKLSAFHYQISDSDDVLRQAKNALITLLSLSCHAAIRGGLSPAAAYLLSDHYLAEVEKCSHFPILNELGNMMLSDYTQRVHRIRSSVSAVSPQIQSVCDRLMLSPEENPTLASLAKELGYSESYLSRKFHQETGLTLKDFLLQQKIEKAKTLLRSTTLSIVAVSEKLGFCSPSYFGKLFRESTGMSPGEFRMK